jgi:hypothetical protein
MALSRRIDSKSVHAFEEAATSIALHHAPRIDGRHYSWLGSEHLLGIGKSGLIILLTVF